MTEKKCTILFFICELCDSPSLIHPADEESLPYFKAIKCASCGYEHKDPETLRKLSDYSKTTRPME